MLSYQHQYHAGNFADVHKHLLQRLLFESLLKKTKPFCYIDCHSGSGQYNLREDAASKTMEYSHGIERLWNAIKNAKQTPQHPALSAYLDAISTCNNSHHLHYYPGSPALAQQWLRDSDIAILLELHPQAFSDLRHNFATDNRISLHARDCYEGLPALIPPPIKRGLVLFDPSYEIKDEYQQIVELLKRAHQRWATAIYAIWYPLLPAGRHHQLLRALKQSGLKNIISSELTIADSTASHGMYGSGMAIINTPWQLDQRINELLPSVATILSPDHGRASLQWLAGE
ncbi:MAG: 23S rRNA (adenine(2030)-N(6))-methyltransferase RlmJ [Spongiibacteraceae bacterium]